MQKADGSHRSLQAIFCASKPLLIYVLLIDRLQLLLKGSGEGSGEGSKEQGWLPSMRDKLRTSDQVACHFPRLPFLAHFCDFSVVS